VDYSEKQLKPLDLPGFWKFLPWLPCENWNSNFKSGTVVYKSEGLASELKLDNLYIAFNGYWPEKSANMLTCTFKELEAPPTFQRATEKCVNSMVIASAGNTAKAFINAARFFNINLYVVVPYTCRKRLVLPFEKPNNVIFITPNRDSDYSDSIAFARRMTNELKIMNEDGARNVARRDGMGTVMLESVLHMNRLPDHYFQAVGSGTGAISAYEAVERFLNGGQFTGKIPKLHLSQNKPFTPLVDAWEAGLKTIKQIKVSEQREAIANVYAKVLTNRHPPYSIGGGVYDILSNSNGEMYGVTNSEALSAGKLFESLEGIDLVPASSVAVGSLVSAIEKNNVDPQDTIIINITGGGEKRLYKDYKSHVFEPDIVCESDIEMKNLKSALEVFHE
jgi:cysteate synthase